MVLGGRVADSISIFGVWSRPDSPFDVVMMQLWLLVVVKILGLLFSILKVFPSPILISISFQVPHSYCSVIVTPDLQSPSSSSAQDSILRH